MSKTNFYFTPIFEPHYHDEPTVWINHLSVQTILKFVTDYERDIVFLNLKAFSFKEFHNIDIFPDFDYLEEFCQIVGNNPIRFCGDLFYRNPSEEFQIAAITENPSNRMIRMLEPLSEKVQHALVMSSRLSVFCIKNPYLSTLDLVKKEMGKHDQAYPQTLAAALAQIDDMALKIMTDTALR